MKKIFLNWQNVEKQCLEIIRQIVNDNWKPDYIVGLTRGGLIPAVMMSNSLDIPMHTLEVKLRDHANTESNLWMAEDAFGYIPEDMREGITKRSDATYKKNILIIDDINDTGATLDWIINDWQQSCLPNDPDWEYVWGNNVRFAVLIDNLSSNFSRKVDYAGKEINKAERDVWIVYPWER